MWKHHLYGSWSSENRDTGWLSKKRILSLVTDIVLKKWNHKT